MKLCEVVDVQPLACCGALVAPPNVGCSSPPAQPAVPSCSPTACLFAHRLLQTGSQVAAVDVSGSGPAPTPVRGSGVLRLWPGVAVMGFKWLDESAAAALPWPAHWCSRMSAAPTQMLPLVWRCTAAQLHSTACPV